MPKRGLRFSASTGPLRPHPPPARSYIRALGALQLFGFIGGGLIWFRFAGVQVMTFIVGFQVCVWVDGCTRVSSGRVLLSHECCCLGSEFYGVFS